MIFYLDSSVLVKKYFEEVGTDSIQKVWKDNKHLAISQVGYSEILGTINKKQKIDRFSEKIKLGILKQFQNDWRQLIKINVDGSMNSELDRVHSKYLLRGFDAIHLVSGIFLFRELREEFSFLSADENLSSAAEKDGLDIGKFIWK